MRQLDTVRSLKAALAEFDRALPERLPDTPGERLSWERARIVEDVVRSLFAPFAQDPLALLATGGFGSHDLTPASDVDLLFVRHPGDSRVEEAVAAVLYPLWDAGLRVSHAVRTPEECEVESANRLASLTAMATARPIAGDEELGRASYIRSVEVARRDPLAFASKLRASRTERGERFGRLAHLLEPDLKESLGGERDRQVAWWIAGTLGPFGRDGRLLETRRRGDEWPLVRPAGAARREPAFGQSVLDVRLALHVVNGATSNRLLAEHHEAVARLLGLSDRPKWEARDLLMSGVAASGRAIDVWAERLLDSLQAQLEGEPAASVPRRGAPVGLAAVEAPASGDPWSPRLLEAFLEVLRDGPSIERALEEGLVVLLEALPEWRDVRGRPQRDPYHRYPVDVHLIQTVTEARWLLMDPGESFAVQAAASVGDPDVLLLGALLHDIGKVGKGSHVSVGVGIARQVLDRMGVEGRRREDVLFLVREHLLLADSATRRNIQDEDLVLRVAGRIGTPERLGLLYLLTVADANATGPSACTPWRMNLIRDLVSKVSLVIDRGHVDLGRVHRLERAEASVRDALEDRPAEEVEAFLEAVPSAYLLWVRPADVPVHFEMMRERPRPDEVRVDVRPGKTRDAHLVTVVGPDRLGLLADVAGALSVAGLSILAAQAFTSDRGVALDEFEVRGAFEPDVPAERWDRFRATLSDVVRGADLEGKVRSLRAHYGRSRPTVPVHIRVEQESSDFFTVVEVEGPDRIGLLFDLGRTFARAGVDVHLAKVATYGPRVVDVFYVTDEAGEKVQDAKLLAGLEQRLAEAASG